MGHAMEKIRREIGQELIYSAALVTDNDRATLFLAARRVAEDGSLLFRRGKAVKTGRNIPTVMGRGKEERM